MSELESNPEKRLALFQRKEVRRELEKKNGRKVVTNENYLGLTQVAKKAKRIK